MKISAVWLLPALTILCTNLKGQHGPGSVVSESIIKFNLNDKTTDKPIPFDRYFTLVIDSLNNKNIYKVYVFEAKFIDGVRKLKADVKENKKKNIKEESKADFELNPLPGEPLKLPFYPLKPNKDFDIAIVRHLTGERKTLAYKLNSVIANGGDYDAFVDAFWDLEEAADDPEFARTHFGFDDEIEYLIFYYSKLGPTYDNLNNNTGLTYSAKLDRTDLQAFEVAARQLDIPYNHGGFLEYAIDKSLQKQIAFGLLPLNAGVLKKSTDKTAISERVQNISGAIAFYDTLLQKMNTVLAKGVERVTVIRNRYSIEAARDNVIKILAELNKNKSKLSEYLDQIDGAMINSEKMYEVLWLVGSTKSTDLKSKGNTLFIVDVGLTNLLLPNIRNTISYIPRLYWGANIYFRSIDKNTRSNKFRQKYPKNSEFDYNIASRWSPWQHLSLSLGFTIGSLPSTEFENLYNNMSLTIGPAYRFKQAFKASAGLSLVKGIGKNPLISEKKVIPGFYVSASVDIDLIQTLSNITNLLLK